MDSRKWEIIISFLRLSNTVEAGLTRHLSPFGIAFTDLRLMLMILVLQGVSQKNLADHMGVSQVVVSTRLDKLERAGLVTRSHVGHRRVSVTHTETGADLLNLLLHSVIGSAPGRAMEALDSSQTDKVLESIRVLVSSMRVPLEEPFDAKIVPDSTTLPDALRERLVQSPETFEQHVAKEQDRMNRTLKSLEKELRTLVKAFRLLQEKRDQRDGGSLAQGAHSDGD